MEPAARNHRADIDDADRDSCRVPALPIVLGIALLIALLYLFRHATV